MLNHITLKKRGEKYSQKSMNLSYFMCKILA